VAASASDMFCNLYVLKNHKIADNLTATLASGKNKQRFEIIKT
jgi:hypothetical protein